MTHDVPDWLDLLRSRTDRFAELIEIGDLDARIRWCPDWSLRDLVAHLAGVHQWAAHALVEHSPDHVPEPPDPSEPSLADWYRRHATHLLHVLTERPATAPAWTMDPHDPTAGFWRRRQVLETAMHVWDAEDALGRPQPIDPGVAWDGVLEVVEILYPRQLRLGRVRHLPSAIRLVATDVDAETILGDGHVTVIRARADVLWRLLWHRADSTAEGVDPRAAALLTRAVTP